ncbi:hypothetical protein ACFTAO_45965 [Paenibacillus rhizoplanae]
MLEENIKLHLEKLILQLISGSAAATDSKPLATAATLLSWSLYGVTYRWNLEGRSESSSELAERVMPLITGGFPMSPPMTKKTQSSDPPNGGNRCSAHFLWFLRMKRTVFRRRKPAFGTAS